MSIVKRGVYDVEIPKEKRLNAFLAPFDLDLRIKNVRMRIGRFSLGLFYAIKFLPASDDEFVLDIGCFCEAASNAKIIVGGNHQNENLFNVGLTSGKIFRQFMDDANDRLCEVRLSKTVEIGDNVILSDSSIVAPGARIGAGSILGAGTVASGELRPVSIYGGVPAKLIKPRFDEDRFKLYQQASFSNVAAHSINVLPTTMMKLQNGEITVDEFKKSLDFVTERAVIEMTVEPRLGSDHGLRLGQITGYRIGNRPIEDETALATLKSYFAQIQSDNAHVKWTPDIFDSLKLYDAC